MRGQIGGHSARSRRSEGQTPAGSPRPAGPPQALPIGTLTGGLSPRTAPCSEEHVGLLAETLDALPPIVVHHDSLAVIDGTHRLEAYRRAGRETIPVVLFTGSWAEAMVLAVEANVRHGLALSLPERKRAAAAILTQFPERSDRWIAGVCGLSHSTVASLRALGSGPAPTSRVGVDGRRRPTDHPAVRGRILAAAAEQPNASIRQIARSAGAAPSTVHALLSGSVNQLLVPAGPPDALSPDHRGVTSDPALADITEWLAVTDVADSHDRYAEAVPVGRVYAVADECRRRAAWWAELADALERRAHRRPGRG